jgi:hypothetical protein
MHALHLPIPERQLTDLGDDGGLIATQQQIILGILEKFLGTEQISLIFRRFGAVEKHVDRRADWDSRFQATRPPLRVINLALIGNFSRSFFGILHKIPLRPGPPQAVASAFFGAVHMDRAAPRFEGTRPLYLATDPARSGTIPRHFLDFSRKFPAEQSDFRARLTEKANQIRGARSQIAPVKTKPERGPAASNSTATNVSWEPDKSPTSVEVSTG